MNNLSLSKGNEASIIQDRVPDQTILTTTLGARATPTPATKDHLPQPQQWRQDTGGRPLVSKIWNNNY